MNKNKNIEVGMQKISTLLIIVLLFFSSIEIYSIENSSPEYIQIEYCNINNDHFRNQSDFSLSNNHENEKFISPISGKEYSILTI